MSEEAEFQDSLEPLRKLSLQVPQQQGITLADIRQEDENGNAIPSRPTSRAFSRQSMREAAVHLKAETTEAAVDTARWVKKLLYNRTTAVLLFITFAEAFTYSMIVTSLPILASDYLGWGKFHLAVLSMVNKFLSVVISGCVYFLADYLQDFLLLAYGIQFSLLSLLCLAVLELVTGFKLATTVFLFAIATLAIGGVPLVLTSSRAMLAKLVPSEVQSLVEAVRMSVFEAAFVPAGFLVPLVAVNLTATAIGLFALSLLSLVLTIGERYFLVCPQEEDDYWNVDSPPRTNSPKYDEYK